MNPLKKLWQDVFGGGDSDAQETADDGNEPVLLGVPGDPATAALWQDMLKQQDIRCMVRDGGALGGLTGMDTPKMEVYVLEADLARARQVVGVED